MKLMKPITAFILLVCALGVAEADVGLNMHFYNSQDDLSVGLTGEALNFEGMAQLMPDSLLYNNGGVSNNPVCSYSYEIALNGEKLESGVTTDSGAFSWNTRVDLRKDGPRSFTLSPKRMVKNGIEVSNEANNNVRNQQHLYTTNSAYSNSATISPNTLNSVGKGGTLETGKQDTTSNSENEAQSGSTQDSHQIKGFLDVATVTGTEKSSSIVTNIQGDTTASWQDKTSSSDSKYSMGEAVIGTAKTGMSDLSMEGKATGFPDQRLPPGTLKLEVNILETPEHQAIRELFTNEIRSFNAKFPKASVPLWYYIDERASIPSANGDNNIPTYSGESYKMIMQFTIND